MIFNKWTSAFIWHVEHVIPVFQKLAILKWIQLIHQVNKRTERMSWKKKKEITLGCHSSNMLALQLLNMILISHIFSVVSFHFRETVCVCIGFLLRAKVRFSISFFVTLNSIKGSLESDEFRCVGVKVHLKASVFCKMVRFSFLKPFIYDVRAFDAINLWGCLRFCWMIFFFTNSRCRISCVLN